MSEIANATNFSDEDLTFFALTYNNYVATEACLKDLRKHYPNCRVILRSDGDNDPRLRELCQFRKIEYRAESRLFRIVNGGAIIERMLVLFLEQPSQYLFKIDPDTVIHHRFKYLPIRSGIFGTLQTLNETPAVQGGCMGFTRDVVEQILGCGMLRESRLKEPGKYINDSPYFFRMSERAERCGLASFDWIIGWIAAELRIAIYAFDEVNSGWKMAPPNPDGRYAVTHPR